MVIDTQNGGEVVRRPPSAAAVPRDAFGLATVRRPNTANGCLQNKGMFGYVANPYKRDPFNSEIAACLEQQHAEEQLQLLQKQQLERDMQQKEKQPKKQSPPGKYSPVRARFRFPNGIVKKQSITSKNSFAKSFVF